MLHFELQEGKDEAAARAAGAVRAAGRADFFISKSVVALIPVP